MSKLWISAALVAVISGVTAGLLLTQEPQPAQKQAGKDVDQTQPSDTPAAAPLASAEQTVAPAQPQAQAPAPLQRELKLWDQQSLVAGESHGVPVHETQIDPSLLQAIGLDQTLTLGLPGRQQPVRATLTETRNNGGAAVWQGKLLDGSDADNLTLVRGALETHITVNTLDGTLSMIIDNATGKTVITDENELVLRADPNDAVPFGAGELPPMAPPARG
ncbi:hypothetical protein AAFN46_09285 [Pseudomonas sp. CAU 1711]|uniref:hypothetical protein n=1 Tax=Pseudomonas sp. CAU 1711 TaxID=3140356 RepID=UPI003261254A